MRLQGTQIFRIEARRPFHIIPGFVAFFFVVIAYLLSASTVAASAINIYIAQSSTGAANGADCADAYAYTFFNNSTNWGSGANQIGPGTTVHICGTITGTAGTSGLTFHGSGTSGSPITLEFESGAKLLAPYWGTGGGSTSAAIVVSGVSYIVIDGGATGNAGAGTFVANGLIQDTLNGTLGGACPAGACTSNHDSTGIGIQNVSNLTIQNLSILNMYTRTSLSEGIGAGYSIQKLGTGNSVTINNVVLAQAETHIWWNLPSGSDSNLIISNSDISNCSAGVGIAQGSGNTGLLSSFSFFGNHVHDFASWNETSAYNFHHDGVHIYTYTTPLANINVYKNKWDGDLGSGTAWIYYEQYAAGTGAINIFNNIFNSYATQSGNGAGGSRMIEFEGNAVTGKIYNNTLIGVTLSGTIMSGIYNNGSPASNMDLRNNTIGGNLEALVEGTGLATTSNNNNYDFSGGSHILVNGLGYNASNFSAWKTACSCDSASITLAPNLDSNFRPQSGSSLILAAQNLTSQGITALDSDYSGTPRPSSGNWDIGANGVSLSSNAPLPPSSLVATIQ